ncbi:MAG: hypothetical protein MJZ34_07015 [Paludibacteraceae bacterium]|nr:hypothetical protein [Paludibacteraceae bacterium]
MILLNEYHLETDKAEEVIEMLNEFLSTHDIVLDIENIDNANGIVTCVVDFDGIKFDELLKVVYEDDDDIVYVIREDEEGRVSSEVGHANLTIGAELKHLATAIDKEYSSILKVTMA